MLDVKGLNIKEMPFEGLKLFNEILSFEGMPIFLHFIDSNGKDVIAYLVDFDKTGSRWLYGKVNRKELFDYLIGSKSLKSLFSEISSDYLFLIDQDKNANALSFKLILSYLLPDKYFPNDDSYYLDGLNNLYEDYLTEDYYLYRLRQNSFMIKVEPSDKIHRNTVGAKEAAIVLNGATSSIEGYIKVKAFNLLKQEFGDVAKINRRINKTKNVLSPRISEAAFGSFEVWLAIDTLTFHGEDKIDSELRKDLIEGYKQDVLDVDFTSEEDAKIIAEKFTEDEIKLIYEPFVKLLDNDKIKISINDTKNTISRGKGVVKLSNSFKNVILPPPTLEVYQKELERKNKIISVVLNLKEGEDVTKIAKNYLVDNLLFTQEIGETPYEINSPVLIDGNRYDLRKPLRCILSVAETGKLQLYNSLLEIFEEGEDLHLIADGIRRQFVTLVQNLEEIAKTDYPKAEEIKSYLA